MLRRNVLLMRDFLKKGAFRRKSAEEATQLIKELAKSNYRAPYEA